MTNGRMIELAVAIVALAASVWLYRSQRKANEGYGSQGAVVLLVVGAIMAIHALGLLEYRPSASEIEAAKRRAR
ncbi:MAG: hypothetical protein ACJ8FN_00020 [Sphingomicrobium sp.]